MKELLELATTYLRGMWHRRWIGLATAWLVAIVAVAIVFRVPERYEASARVYVDTDSLLKPLLAGLAIQPNLDQQVALIGRTLINRPNIEKLIRQADLDLAVRNTAQRDALIDNVTRNIRLEGSRGNLYTIIYRDFNPERARKAVQALLTIFVESSLGNKQKDTQTAVSFVDEQIKRYEDALRSAEERLKEFKIKYMGVATRGDGGDYFARLSQLRTAIDDARMELQANEQARDSYKRDLSGESPMLLPDPGTSPIEISVPGLDSRLAALKGNLDELLRKYTDSHPDVVSTKRRIQELEAQRQAEVEARRKAMVSAPVSVERSPVYEQLRMSLAQAEANVASSRAKLAGYESQYSALKAQAQLVPTVEQEFAQLNRDYDVQKKTYETLLARRDAAALGKDVQDTGGAQFRVIDPPRVSPEPVPPTRPMLIGAAFAVALGAGLLMSFVASQLFPTFHAPVTLRSVTNRPFLGMVSMLPDAALTRMRRRSAVLFAGGLGGFFVTLTAVLAFSVLIGRTI